MEHLAIVPMIASVIASALLFSRVVSLNFVFKTSYLKFAIIMIIFIMLGLTIDLMFFYQLINLGNVDSFARNLYTLFSFPLMHIVSFCLIYVLHRIANGNNRRLIKVYLTFVILVILLDVVASQQVILNLFRNEYLSVIYMYLVIIVQILAKVGVLLDINHKQQARRRLVAKVIIFFLAFDFIGLSVSTIQTFSEVNLSVIVFITYLLLSLSSLIQLAYVERVVFMINDDKSAHLKVSSEYFDLIYELSITTREMEIIELIIKGSSNKQIANQLCISVHTVKDHTRKIYQKTGVSNRVELTNLFSN